MSGFFDPTLLDRIRSASEIVEIIGGYIPLKRAGANFVALCPFHREKSPSFNVNPQKQIFYCFGCHKGGDVFSFVKEYENLPFPDAVRRLAERAKIPIETVQSPGQQQHAHVKETLLKIHEQITQRWQNALTNEAAGHAAREYLKKRGVSDEAVKIFRLGAAPEVWDDTVNWARSKGFDLALVEQAGLIIRKEETGNYYDRFRGRLMFPICDEQGRPIGFSGRILSGDEKIAKYVNSPETPIFTKGRVMFGLDKSKRALLDNGFAIICEGQLDLIACYMAGVQNVVAPQGTALTGDHTRILKRYVDEVVLCFDSDNAGQKATVRSLDSLIASGLSIRVAIVPAPHDPDSFIKANGGEAFKQLIGRAEGFFDYYLGRLCATNDITTDKGRLAVLESMAEATRKTGNSVLVDTYAQKTALRLGVKPDAARAEFRKAPAKTPVARESAEEFSAQQSAPEPEAPRPNATEFWLLKLVFNHDDLIDFLIAHLDPAWLAHAGAHELIERRLDAHSSGSWSSIAALVSAISDTAQQRLLAEVATNDRPIPEPQRQLSDVILRIRNDFIDRQLAGLSQRANDPATAEPQRLDILRRQQDLRLRKRQPLAPLGA
jgi:DNA primase